VQPIIVYIFLYSFLFTAASDNWMETLE
jgi:hypothetical protein